jgi:hypothetical protein
MECLALEEQNSPELAELRNGKRLVLHKSVAIQIAVPLFSLKELELTALVGRRVG